MRLVNIGEVLCVCVSNGGVTWLGCWLVGMMMVAVAGCGYVEWFRGGKVKVCGIEGKACGFQGALFCWFAMLNGLTLSLLYSHEPRVGCHVEGVAVCRELLQT